MSLNDVWVSVTSQPCQINGFEVVGCLLIGLENRRTSSPYNASTQFIPHNLKVQDKGCEL